MYAPSVIGGPASTLSSVGGKSMSSIPEHATADDATRRASAAKERRSFIELLEAYGLGFFGAAGHALIRGGGGGLPPSGTQKHCCLLRSEERRVGKECRS